MCQRNPDILPSGLGSPRERFDGEINMKTKIIIALIASVIGFAGCKPKETEFDRYNREANKEMLEYCTNKIVGLNHFISVGLLHFITDSNNNILEGDINDPHNWEGKVVAEYVNHQGGIDRTNLTFRFTLDTNEMRIPKVFVSLDYHWLAVQESIKEQAEFEAWKRSLNSDEKQ